MNWVPDCVPLPRLNDIPAANKRRSTRIPCRVPVLLQTSDGRDIHAICVDVNAGGIAIETETILAVGQRVKLILQKKDGEVKAVPMLVIYRMEKHYGLSALDNYEDILDLLPVQA